MHRVSVWSQSEKSQTIATIVRRRLCTRPWSLPSPKVPERSPRQQIGLEQHQSTLSPVDHRGRSSSPSRRLRPGWGVRSEVPSPSRSVVSLTVAAPRVFSRSLGPHSRQGQHLPGQTPAVSGHSGERESRDRGDGGSHSGAPHSACGCQHRVRVPEVGIWVGTRAAHPPECHLARLAAAASRNCGNEETARRDVGLPR